MPLTFALLDNVGLGELAIISGIALLLFGKDMPAVAKKVGKVIAEFKYAMSQATADITREMDSAARAVEEEKANLAKGVSISEAKPAPKPWEPPVVAKPAVAAPLALDSNTPSVSSVPATPAAKSASLDTFQREIPAPTKIPPPIA